MTHQLALSWRRPGLLALGLALALALGSSPRPVAAQPPAVIFGAFSCEKELGKGGAIHGQVFHGQREVLDLLTGAGGLNAYERALIVAGRLQDALAAGVKPAQLRVAKVGVFTVLQAGAINLLTVTSEEATAQGLTVGALAQAWLASISAAFSAPPEIALTPTVVTPPAPTATDKLVPVLDAGGVKLGLARVHGPALAIAQVTSVARVGADYQNALPFGAYVPVATEAPGDTLARIPGVYVTDLSVPAPSAAGLTGAFRDVVRVWGVGWIVAHFGPNLNHAINDALAARQAALPSVTRVVPILVVGGTVATGAAQVTGPAEQLAQVQAVARSDWTQGGEVRGHALRPVAVDRDVTADVPAVDGVAVSAIISFPQ